MCNCSTEAGLLRQRAATRNTAIAMTSQCRYRYNFRNPNGMGAAPRLAQQLRWRGVWMLQSEAQVQQKGPDLMFTELASHVLFDNYVA